MRIKISIHKKLMARFGKEVQNLLLILQGPRRAREHSNLLNLINLTNRLDGYVVGQYNKASAKGLENMKTKYNGQSGFDIEDIKKSFF